MVPGRIEQGMTYMPRSQNWYNCLHLPAYQRGQVSSFCSLHHVKAPSNFLAGVRLCKEMTLIVKSRAVMEGNSKGILSSTKRAWITRSLSKDKVGLEASSLVTGVSG